MILGLLGLMVFQKARIPSLAGLEDVSVAPYPSSKTSCFNSTGLPPQASTNLKPQTASRRAAVLELLVACLLLLVAELEM